MDLAHVLGVLEPLDSILRPCLGPSTTDIMIVSPTGAITTTSRWQEREREIS